MLMKCAPAVTGLAVVLLLVACGSDDENGGVRHDTGPTADVIDPCAACKAWQVCKNGACDFDVTSMWNIVALNGEVTEKNPVGESWDALGGLPDPFLCLTVASARKCTTAAQDTLKPNWNQMLHTNVGGGSLIGPAIKVEYYDDDLTTPDKICELSATLKLDFLDAGAFNLNCQQGMANVQLKYVK